MPLSLALLLLAIAASTPAQEPAPPRIPDPRHLANGRLIPDEGYSDQPYIAKAADGAWVCIITTGPGVEGAGGQHVVSMRSTDQGRTWSAPVALEPSSGPEASYAVILRIPASGRLYVFYNHNTDNVRQVIGDKPVYRDGLVRRVDSLGHFVFKYSDDHGRTWSPKRYEIPQRDFAIDRRNPYSGKLKFFWNVGKAFVHRNAGYVPLHKVGGFGEGFFTSSEGVLLRSRNILTEVDPDKLVWETLPDGDVGIRAPEGEGGPVAEEHSFAELSDGALFCVFRTIDGHAAFTYSRDGGRTWEPSQYMRYADGRLMKHPRAANFAWRTANGRFLYWFHNHGGRFIREHARRRTIAYEERNPVWLVGGIEADSPKGKVIRWSQPEIALYEDDPVMRMSYPDLVEEDGRYYFTETQKEVARLHEIDRGLIEGLWSQFEPGARAPVTSGLLLDVRDDSRMVSMPALPAFTRRTPGGHGTEDLRAGFTLDLTFTVAQTGEDRPLLDNRDETGAGFVLLLTGAALELVLNDGRAVSSWRSDSVLKPGTRHHANVIVDGGPKIISFVIDGQLHDGGTERQFGWGRFHPYLRSVNASPTLRIAREVERVRIYGRALRTSEAIANGK